MLFELMPDIGGILLVGIGIIVAYALMASSSWNCDDTSDDWENMFDHKKRK